MKKKRHLKTSIKVGMILTIAISLLGYGGYQITNYYHNKNEVDTLNEESIKQFEEDISNNEVVDDSKLIEGDVVGVMYIPAVNLKHCIAMGVTDDVLHNYIGLFTSYAKPGEIGNAVFSAHSSYYGWSEISYFNRIDFELEIGDEVNILWKDGVTYNYKVRSIKQYVEPSDRSYFEQPDDEEIITLGTCTAGNPNYRSYVVCERVY